MTRRELRVYRVHPDGAALRQETLADDLTPDQVAGVKGFVSYLTHPAVVAGALEPQTDAVTRPAAPAQPSTLPGTEEAPGGSGANGKGSYKVRDGAWDLIALPPKVRQGIAREVHGMGFTSRNAIPAGKCAWVLSYLVQEQLRHMEGPTGTPTTFDVRAIDLADKGMVGKSDRRETKQAAARVALNMLALDGASRLPNGVERLDALHIARKHGDGRITLRVRADFLRSIGAL